MGHGRRAYLTVAEAALRCGVSRRTVQSWIRGGKLSASRLPGGHYRIHEDVLKVFLRSRRPPEGVEPRG